MPASSPRGSACCCTSTGCSTDRRRPAGGGEPNGTGVSIVHLLSETRVGVSCQFMNKTLRNLRETGRVQINVMHPGTLAEYRLDPRILRLIDRGPGFDRMAATH